MSRRAASLHRSPWQGVLYVTGGGSRLLSELLTTPGASATVLEASVPYAEAALADLLGRRPEQACSEATARALAMTAFQRARHLTGGAIDELFGLACTASLATRRTKRGAHRAHVAVQTHAATYAAAITFEGGDREEQEAELQELLWRALAEALDLSLPPDDAAVPLRPATVVHTPAERPWRNLILGLEVAFATAPHDGRLLLPGAFNPLHHAHRRMLEIAEQKTGLSGAFELSVVNVDKPPLDYIEIERRLEQFDRPVWLTRLPTFVEKARQFPGVSFAVGIDTLIRIIDPAYYGTPEARDRALSELAELDTRFVVFGRKLESGFLGLGDVNLPDPLRRLCLEVTQEEFDEPVSSTSLRRGGPR
ncbi:MAG TPA: hypothetical protein VF210_04850 [Pseudomonadales bacterium]